MTADAVGGVWTYALDLARALAPFDVDVTLAVMGPRPSSDQYREAAGVGNLTVHARDFRLEWMDSPWADVDRAGDWLLELARRTVPDVVHLNGYCHATLAWGVPVVVVAHSCVCSWWRAVHNEAAPASWNSYRERVGAGLRSADVVVAPTRAMLDALTECYGAEATRAARVIFNGRTLGRADGQRSDEDIVKEPLILGMGRLWDDAKNLAALARVAPALPWPVYIAGDATPPAGAGATGFPTSSARLLGRLPTPDAERWLRRAALYALPARYEPFGLSAAEAALAGSALVLGDIPSLREVWGDGAWFVAPDDDAALTHALATLAQDERSRSALATRARARARALTPAAMAAAYHDLYATLLASHATQKEVVACAS